MLVVRYNYVTLNNYHALCFDLPAWGELFLVTRNRRLAYEVV